MKSDQKYLKITEEFDRVVQTELNDRIGNKSHPRYLPDIDGIFEHRNRQIVVAHQQDTIGKILYPIFVVYLQSREGGKLYLSSDGVKPDVFSSYIKRKERFETLFTAALMALKERELADIVNRKKLLFDEQHHKLKEINRLAETARHIRKKAVNTKEGRPSDREGRDGHEKRAVDFLMKLAPLKADLNTIEVHCLEFRENRYLKPAVQYLENELQTTDRVIAEAGREASKFLFDNAGAVFHVFKSTLVSLANTEQFVAQKEELARYARIFDSIGDTERKEELERFAGTIDGTLDRLRQEIGKQKESEGRLAQKHQQEISDAYDGFLEIKNQFAAGRLASDSQQKNAAEKLKRYRDTLIANGQRVMARDIDRFINSTGIGKPARSLPAPGELETDTFDYKKGFLILLPISVILLVLVLTLLIL